MTDSQPSNPAVFADAIQRYHALSEQHAHSARSYSISITVLIAFGLFVVISLPYVLSQADKLFRSEHTVAAVERQITDIESRIEEAVRQTPSFLTQQVFSLTPENEPLYYPGLKPLWPAVSSPEGIWVVSGDDGHLLTSDDAGQTWLEQATYTTAALWPPVFADRKTGVITGDQGTLLNSTDGGRTWSKDPLSLSGALNGTLNAPVFSSEGVGIITSDEGYLLVKASSQGSWNILRRFPGVELHQPEFSPNGTGLIAGGQGTLLVSTDHGKTWTQQATTTEQHLRHITHANGRWLITGDLGALLISDDNAQTWRTAVTATDKALNPAIITKNNRAVVSGEDGTLLVSDPDWQKWTPVDHQVNSDLHAVMETAQGLLIASGDDGALLTSEDDGEQWINQSLTVETDLNRPVMFSSLGLISGDEGVLLLSNNGGKSWRPINTATPADLALPVQSPEGTLFIAGDDGTLLTSDANGLQWTNLRTGIPTDLNPPVFHDDSLATLSSYGGLYQLIDVTDLKDEDRLVALMKALEKSTQRTTAETLAQLEEQKILLEDYKTTLVEFDKSGLNDQLEKSLVRVSALAVIMFLVQVLITNYRYSVKLSNFYLARAQGLSVVADIGMEKLSAEDIGSLLGSFTPSTEFGKQVETPIDKVMALAEKMKKV